MHRAGIGSAALIASGIISLPAATLAQNASARPSVRAAQTSEAPSIDGVLDEIAWQAAEIVDSFTQQEPHEGQPATDRTEVRVLYDRGHLYIGVRAYASDPVVATEMRRDSDRLVRCQQHRNPRSPDRLRLRQAGRQLLREPIQPGHLRSISRGRALH
jgi:hypothetical protein